MSSNNVTQLRCIHGNAVHNTSLFAIRKSIINVVRYFVFGTVCFFIYYYTIELQDNVLLIYKITELVANINTDLCVQNYVNMIATSSISCRKSSIASLEGTKTVTFLAECINSFSIPDVLIKSTNSST